MRGLQQEILKMYKRTDELNCKQPKNRHMEGK